MNISKETAGFLLVNIFALIMVYFVDIQTAAPFMAAGFIIAALSKEK